MAEFSNSSSKTQDERIRRDVCRQLMWQADIDSEEIVIEVKNSAVVLIGRVESCLERQVAETAAYAAYGVSSVTNNILVEPKTPRTDSEIAEDVSACLRTTTCVLEELPSVSVTDGIVTLRGQAHWKSQVTSAERAADAVIGVRQVRNFIKIAPSEPLDPCRQISRERLDLTPSSMNFGAAKQASSCRLLFFVPSVVGRA